MGPLEFSWATISLIDIGVLSISVIGLWWLKNQVDRYRALSEELDTRYNTLQQEHNTLQQTHEVLQEGAVEITKNIQFSVKICDLEKNVTLSAKLFFHRGTSQQKRLRTHTVTGFSTKFKKLPKTQKSYHLVTF